MRDRLFVLLQHVLPQHALSRLTHRVTRVRIAWLKNLIIKSFVWLFAVDMEDARTQRLEDYACFNDFFTRDLKPGARPCPADLDALACPVDGTVSEAGLIEKGLLLQAKGHRYPLTKLLGDAGEATDFEGGVFVTIYLAPYNYHRIHMPANGSLKGMRYLPGRLFSVNGATVARVPFLFARNERVVCSFESPCGPMAMILVGALNVGSIETVWAGEVAPSEQNRPSLYRYTQDAVSLARGEEMGRFNMGSTVILIFGAGRVRLDDSLRPGKTVRVGQSIGHMAATHVQSSDST